MGFPPDWLELLNFDLNLRPLKVITAAMADPGPLPHRVWAARAGIPVQHLAAAFAELERVRAAVVVNVAEGVRIMVQPMALWRGAIRPRQAWLAAWRQGPAQSKLDIATEQPDLPEALSNDAARIVALPKADTLEDLAQLQEDLAHIRHLPPVGVSPQIGELAPQFGEQVGSPQIGETAPQIGEQGQFPAPQIGERTGNTPGEADLPALGEDPKMRGTEGPSPCPDRPSGGGEKMEQPAVAQAKAPGRPGRQRVALPLQPRTTGPIGSDGPGPPGASPQFGERSVPQSAPQFGEQVENAGGRAAEGSAASTPSPTPPPPQERLNAERLTLNSGDKSPGGTPAQRSASSALLKRKENELLKRIARVVEVDQPDDMKYWGADWRVNWVRKFSPDVIEAALADCELVQREKQFKPKLCWAAYLKDVIRRFANSPG